ncbi:hypothetical protein ACFE04_031520 [Oxalis oulophora]
MDQISTSSNSQNSCKKPIIPSLFGSPSPRFDIQTVMSPTSILDNISPKSYAQFLNPFWSDNIITTPKVLKSPKIKCEANIGLALIDTIQEETHSCDQTNNNNNKMIFFGGKLRIQIPTQTDSPKISTHGCLTVSEMELSEDYTCIISHGPDPKTTHVFDDCIVESYLCLSGHDHNTIKKEDDQEEEKSFLSFCHSCNKNLEQSHDIYIYRGDKAFCSNECRYQEMLLDEFENY